MLPSAGDETALCEGDRSVDPDTMQESANAAAGSAHRRIAADQNNRIMAVFYQNIPFLSHLFAIQFMVYGVIAVFYVK